MESGGKGARRIAGTALACLALLAALAPSTSAQLPELWVFGDAEHAGTIHLLIYGPAQQDALVYEEIDGMLYPLRAVKLDQDGVGAGWDIERWHCGRRERRFVVRVESPDDGVLSATYETRTPSCRDRMALQLPRRARRGETVRATVRDRWRIGGIHPRLCTAPPGDDFRCRRVDFAAGQRQVASGLRLGRKGTWRVQLRLFGYQLTRRFEAGGPRSFVLRRAPQEIRVLLTGDSMMLNIDGLLKDRLRGKVETVSDEHVGSGVSKSGFDWVAHARRQVRRLRPRATVVFLGANDAAPMSTPPPVQRVDCCGEPWIAEYARRVTTMMRTYRRNGSAALVWLTLPAPRNSALAESFAAVNEGIRTAAQNVPGVRVLSLDELFTPGFRWRAEMRVRGRTRRVRADDGIHLALLGARIAAIRVARELGSLGLL